MTNANEPVTSAVFGFTEYDAQSKAIIDTCLRIEGMSRCTLSQAAAFFDGMMQGRYEMIAMRFIKGNMDHSFNFTSRDVNDRPTYKYEVSIRGEEGRIFINAFMDAKADDTPISIADQKVFIKKAINKYPQDYLEVFSGTLQEFLTEHLPY